MNALQLIKSARGLAAGAYLTPWRDQTRARIMIIGFLANLGYGTLSFTLNYSMATEGLTQSLIFQILRMALMAYLIVPATFWFLVRYQSRWLLLIIQLLGLGLYFIDRSNGLINAIAVSLAFAPYLGLFNYRFSKNQSTDNRGNEVALNTYLVIFGYSGGLFMGGLSLHHGIYYPTVVIASLCTILGAFFLYHPIGAKNNWEKVKALVSPKKPSTRITFFNGLFNVMVDGGMPIWMHAMGISPLGAGINMSLRPMIGMVLTPVVGWMVQKGGIKTSQIGGAAMLIGWLFMTAAMEWPFMLSFALAVLSIGSNLVSPMEVGRWFKRRSSAAVISREMVIAGGRMPAYGISILASFLFPVIYPVIGLGVSALFIWGMRPRRRGLGQRIKEVVGLD